MKHNASSTGILFYGVCYFLWSNVGSVSLKTVESCDPACAPGRGLCIEGRCFCHSPYGGEDCSDIVYNPTPQHSGAQRPLSGDDVPRRHTSRERYHEDDSESSTDGDDGPDLDLFGVGDEASEHPHSTSRGSEAPEPSLHVETGELSLQQNRFDSNGLTSLDDADSSSRMEQAVDVDTHRTDTTAAGWASWPLTPAPTEAPSSTARKGAPSVIQTAARAVRQWPDVFGWLWQTPDVAPAKHQSSEMRTHQELFSSHAHGQPSLRHHRRHKERPLLFASSEPAYPVSAWNQSGNLSCVPWLAELRALDLYNLTRGEAEPVKVDLKTARREAYENRLVAGVLGLSKTAFLQSLHYWLNGPTYSEGLKLFDLLDTSDDGVLTFEEYNWENVCGFRGALFSALSAYGKAWTQGFSFLDTNSDGALQEEEFVKESIGVKFGLTSIVATTIFKSIDSDDSGILTRQEFEMIGGLPRLRVQVAEKEPDETSAFKQADTNNDGHLDDSEFSTHAKDMGDFRETPAIPPVLDELDKNKDGLVQKDEYVNTCWIKTGGLCNEGHCERWRGPASCGLVRDGHYDRPCVCAPGYCAKNGACIPEELHMSSDHVLDPSADRVLDQMHEVNAKTILRSPINPAEAVVAIMLAIAVMNQLKMAITTFPWMGVLLFTLSVIAFQLVTVSCFRSFSVPNSIENSLQLMVLILVACAVTLSITSLSRFWAPKDSRIPMICWFVSDDRTEYGLNKNEEIKVQTYSILFKIAAVLCAIGLYESPMEGVENFSEKFMLISLYVCIIVLDTQLLDTELKETASRRYKHELHISQVSKETGEIDVVAIPSLSAWWNETKSQADLWQYRYVAGLTGKINTYQEKRLSNVRRSRSEYDIYGDGSIQDTTERFCKFHTVRVPEFPAVVKKDMRDCNDMFFVSSCNGVTHGNYVYGRVVVLWDDTEIEFAWYTEGSWKNLDQIMMDEHDDHEPPVLRELPGILALAGSRKQTIQEKMLICTQAGASGLIVGQRRGGYLNADSIDLQPKLPDANYSETYSDPDALRNTWRGTYHLRRFAEPREPNLDSPVTMSENPRDVFNRHDFVSRWMVQSWAHWIQFWVFDEDDTFVEDGIAINTFLIGSCDMQELEFMLEERSQDSGSEARAAEVVELPKDRPMLYALFSERVRPVTNGERCEFEASELSRLVLPHKDSEQEEVRKSFTRVYAHQRQILSNVRVIVDEPGSMYFLVACREWVTDQWFTQGFLWKLVHLGYTCFSLGFVLEMCWLLLRRIHQNGFGVWADFLVLIVMMLNGQNISVPIDWYPFKCVKWREGRNTVGVVLTGIVLVGFSVLSIFIFIYHALGFGIIRPVGYNL